MNAPNAILEYLSREDASTSRRGTATIEELVEGLKLDQETVWEAVAVLMLRKRIILRSILKKRILVVKMN